MLRAATAEPAANNNNNTNQTLLTIGNSATVERTSWLSREITHVLQHLYNWSPAQLPVARFKISHTSICTTLRTWTSTSVAKETCNYLCRCPRTNCTSQEPLTDPRGRYPRPSSLCESKTVILGAV